MRHNAKAPAINHAASTLEERLALLRDGLATELPYGLEIDESTLQMLRQSPGGGERRGRMLAQMQAMVWQLEREAGSGDLEGADMAEVRQAVRRTCLALRLGLIELAGHFDELARASGEDGDTMSAGGAETW